jgi:hypothetical protein
MAQKTGVFEASTDTMTAIPAPFTPTCFTFVSLAIQSIGAISTDGVATCITGYTGISQGSVQYSTNSGRTWNTSAAIGSTQIWANSLYDSVNGRFIIWSNSTILPYSTTPALLATSWTAGTGPVLGTALASTGATGGGNTVISTTAASLIYSSNGTTWTAATPPSILSKIRYGGGLFVAFLNADTSKIIYTSPTGATWTARTITTADAAITGFTLPTAASGELMYVKGTWFFTGITAITPTLNGIVTASPVATSTDGITWVLQSQYMYGNASKQYANTIFDGNLCVYAEPGGTTLMVTVFPAGNLFSNNNFGLIPLVGTFGTNALANMVYIAGSNTYVIACSGTTSQIGYYTPNNPYAYFPSASIQNITQSNFDN